MEDGQIKRLTTENLEEAEAAGCEFPMTACVRGMNYHKTFLGEDRLKYPMKRTGKRGEGKFERISWQEAIDTIAGEWIRIRDTYGPGSRYVNYATGVSCSVPGKSAGETSVKPGRRISGLLQFLQYSLYPSGNAADVWYL